MNKLITCDICGGTVRIFRHALRHEHYHIDGTFNTVLCEICDHEQLHPKPNADEILRFYPSNYYAHNVLNRANLWATLIDFFNLRVRTKDPRINGTVLDIGCGDGAFLKQYRTPSIDKVGINYDSENSMSTDLGFATVVSGDYLKYDFGQKFDYIRANHTLEHILDPVAFTKKLKRDLSDDGIALIAVPNRSGAFAKIFGRYWYLLGVPTHISIFSQKSLVNLFESQGFVVIKAYTNSDFAGLSGSIQIWMNRKKYDKFSNDGPFFQSKLIRIFCHLIAKSLDLIGKGDCVEIVIKKNV
jgi:SAM-dependent methyltransferase